MNSLYDNHRFDDISDINVFISLMLKADFSKLFPCIKEIYYSEGECTTSYWLIPKKETSSPIAAFVALFTYHFLSIMEWNDDDLKEGLLGTDERSKQLISSLLLKEFIYTENNKIQFEQVDISLLNLNDFLSNLYSSIDNTVYFQSDISAKFPFVFFLKLIDYPDNYMEEFRCFIETDTDYIFLNSWTSG